MVISFLYYYYGSIQVNEVIHGQKLTGVRSDGMIKVVSSLFNIATSVSVSSKASE